MYGNWLRMSIIVLGLAFFMPTVVIAQSEDSAIATLDTVVVTATRTEEKVREVTSNVTVITGEMIQKSTASNLGELLLQQGFQIDSGYNGVQRIRVRGIENAQMNWEGNATRVLILLNGRRMNSVQVDFIGLTNVERVEIIRGPSAVQYGPSAMGGVINIITKRGGENTTFRAEAGGGSFELSRFKLAASGQSGDGLIDFSFGAGHQRQGDYKTGEDWVREKSSTGNRIGFNGDLGLNFHEMHRVGLNYNFFGIHGSTHPNNYARDKQPQTFTGYNFQNLNDHNVAVTYDGATKDKAFFWQGQVAFGRYDADYRSYSVTSATPFVPASLADRKVRMKNFTGMMGYDNNGIFALSGGLDYLILESEGQNILGWGSDSIANKPEFKDFGTFISGKFRFLDDSLIFSIGGRFDYYEIERGAVTDNINESKTNFVPSIGAAYHMTDWLKLRSNYSHGFKMPAPDQLGGTSSYLPNPDLNPEKTRSWEIGMDANLEFINAGFTYFDTRFDNKIVGLAATTINPGTGNLWWRYENLEGATYTGFEPAISADLGKAFNQDFTLRPYLNLTYFTNMRNDDIRPCPVSGTVCIDGVRHEDMPNNSRMTASYGVDFTKQSIDLKINLNIGYTGEKVSQDWADPAAGAPTYAAPWVCYTPGTLVNISAEKGIWKFENKGKLKVRGEISNLANKYSEIYINYPDAGRSFYGGLIYSFD